MSAIKFEAARIHFLSQVFLAVAVVVSLYVYLQCCPPYNGSRRQPAYKGVDSQKSLCWRVPRIRVVSIYLTVYPH